jgi:WD40 repeat protein
MTRTKGIIILLFCLIFQPTISAQQPTGQESAGEKSHTAALATAKDELLGELSPQTDVPGPEIERHGMKELFGSSAGKPNADYSFDPGSLRFIARAKQGQKWVLIVDGKEKGVFDGLSSVLLYEDHIIYSIKRAGKWVLVLDEKELGPTFDEIGGYHWIFGKAGFEHFAYSAKRGAKWLTVADGKEGPEFDEVGFPQFNGNGQRLAYAAKRGKDWLMVADEKEGQAFEDVGGPAFSPDGVHLAYVAKRKKNSEVLVVDEKAQAEFQTVHYPAFSSDSQHMAYSVKRDKNREFIIVDGREGPEFVEARSPFFSPDSQRLAYLAKREKEWRVVIDGKEEPDPDADVFYAMHFSSDNQRVEYVSLHRWMLQDVAQSKKGTKAWVRRDGKELGPFTCPNPGAHYEGISEPFVDYTRRSRDGQRFAFVLGHRGINNLNGRTTRAQRCAVVDGEVGKMYDTLEMDLMFSRDGKHVAYTVRGGAGDNKSAAVIDGQEGKLYDDVIGGAFRDATDNSGSSQHAFIYIAREGRKFYRVTQPLP